MTSVTDLYKYYETLNGAKDKAGVHTQEFRAIVEAARNGPSNEKRLASQFMVKFNRFFPSLKEDVLVVLLILCKSTDVSIRRQAVKDIEIFCRDEPELCRSTAETLTVLLQSDDVTEVTLIHKAFATLLRTNIKGTLDGIFQQINGGEEPVRERALTFLTNKLKTLIGDAHWLSKEAEDALVAHYRKTLEDVTGSEFVLIMDLLTKLPNMTTVLGRQQLLELVVEQADLSSPFHAEDDEAIERLTCTMKQASRLFSKNVHSLTFVDYLCTNVLPVSGNITAEGTMLEFMKLLAEMSVHTGDMDASTTQRCLSSLFSKLVEFMPLPKDGTVELEDAEPKLEFSVVECLMFTFHQLARKSPEFLTAEKNAERLKDFRLRLQFFARGVQLYIKALRDTLSHHGTVKTIVKKAGTDTAKDTEVKSIALKTANNINTLIKDLFYNPPTFKAVVTLSFKVTPAALSPDNSSLKRQAITPITFDDEPKKVAKDSRKMYVPPSGKFSAKAGGFPSEGAIRGKSIKKW